MIINKHKTHTEYRYFKPQKILVNGTLIFETQCLVEYKGTRCDLCNKFAISHFFYHSIEIFLEDDDEESIHPEADSYGLNV